MSKTNSITLEHKVQAAARMIADVGKHGSVTTQSNESGVSRKTLYQLRQKASRALNEAFVPPRISVQKEEIKRIVLTLFTQGHATIEGIQGCLLETKGVSISTGQISLIIKEAGERAMVELAKYVPSSPRDVALDEIFGRRSGGAYLNIVDVHSQAVWGSIPAKNLTSQAWKELLTTVEGRGVALDVTISDGGSAILCAVEDYFGDRLHRRDQWHIFHDSGKIVSRLERESRELSKSAARAAQKLKRAKYATKQECRAVEELEQEAERQSYTAQSARYLLGELHDLLSVVCVRGGQLLNLEERMTEIACVERLWQELIVASSKERQDALIKIARQFSGVNDELLAFAVDFEEEQMLSIKALGMAAILFIAWVWHNRSTLGGEQAQLVLAVPHAWQEWGARLFTAWDRAVRASSAVENWHSILRPHLAVHRYLSAPQLCLLQFWHNWRIFPRGEHQGKSPLELSGLIMPAVDWLEALGYPKAPHRLSLVA